MKCPACHYEADLSKFLKFFDTSYIAERALHLYACPECGNVMIEEKMREFLKERIKK